MISDLLVTNNKNHWTLIETLTQGTGQMQNIFCREIRNKYWLVLANMRTRSNVVLQKGQKISTHEMEIANLATNLEQGHFGSITYKLQWVCIWKEYLATKNWSHLILWDWSGSFLLGSFGSRLDIDRRLRHSIWRSQSPERPAQLRSGNVHECQITKMRTSAERS